MEDQFAWKEWGSELGWHSAHYIYLSHRLLKHSGKSSPD
jgi:hypothetical protein